MIPKRLFWLTVGYGAGMATSMYLQRRVRRVVVRYTPPEVRHTLGQHGEQAAARARRWGETVRLAMAEGWATMHETEEALRLEHPVPPRVPVRAPR